MSSGVVGRVLDAVLEGRPVDWDHLERIHPNDAAVLRQLRSIEKVARTRVSVRERARVTSNWARHTRLCVLLCAAAQAVAGAVGYLSGFARASAVPANAYFVALAVFGGVAAWLFVGARGDARARALGGFLLLVAASFAPRFIEGSPAAAVFRGLHPEAFLGGFLWGFVRQFPRTVHYSRTDVWCAVAERVSYIAGIILFTGTLLWTYQVPFVPPIVARSHPEGAVAFWTVNFTLLAAAPVAIILRGRQAAPAERERLAMFSIGFGVVLLVVAAEIIAELAIPSFREFASTNRAAATPYFFSVLLILPVTTAYAVLVDNVFDVRVTVGRVVRYVLARHVTAALTVVPLMLLGWYLYSNRHQTIVELSSGWPGIAAAVLFMIGFLLAVSREPALAIVEAHFDRRSVNFAAEAAAVTALLGTARSMVEVADLLEREIQRVLAVAKVVMYTQDSSGDSFRPVNQAGIALPVQSAIAAVLAAAQTPTIVDERATALLPTSDLQWRDRTASEAVVPIVTVAKGLTGFVAIGRKLSGDRLSNDERTFLGAVASAATLRIEAVFSTTERYLGPHDDEPATECATCKRVLETRQVSCDCGGITRPAAVPRMLFGKFQILSYVGRGGMGVVYRGLDTGLNRSVALKTLGRLSAASADRLASEARMMAAVAHPNLATIFGIEKWRHTPVLILEFLERGTLSDRLPRAWTIPEVLSLGVLLVPALEQLHQKGILHRDIKPSNIGFTRDHAPKLLDFGIASLLSESPLTDTRDAPTTRGASATQTVRLNANVTFAGTPLYCPPELLDGAVPSAAFDLWALALVLFETIAGRHPFVADTVSDVLRNIARFESLDLRRWRRDCPAEVAEAFGRLLARDPRHRPSDAAAMRLMLTRLL